MQFGAETDGLGVCGARELVGVLASRVAESAACSLQAGTNGLTNILLYMRAIAKDKPTSPTSRWLTDWLFMLSTRYVWVPTVAKVGSTGAVSYTHLTLPTILLV